MNKAEMKYNKIYAVETKTRLCIGTYKGYCFDEDDKLYILTDVMQKMKPKKATFSYFMRTPRKIKPNAVFGSKDIVYDLEEIKENGQRARQAMEKRSLDMVLKRLVNEHFEW